MTLQAAIHASQMRSSAHQAKNMLGFLEFALKTKAHPLPFKTTIEPAWMSPEAATDSPLVPHQDIATQDWDILFRAIEERLGATVAEELGAPFTLLMDAAAARNKATVLQCISDMKLLHMALKHERQCHQAPDA